VIMNCTDAGCLTAAVMFGVPGIRVLDASDDGGVLTLTVETVEELTACQSCGVVTRAHGRREQRLHVRAPPSAGALAQAGLAL